MIVLKEEMAVVGAINEMLLDQADKGEPLRELLLTPKLVESYSFMIEIRSGCLLLRQFTGESLEDFFLNQDDVFQEIRNLDATSSYRFRIEKFLSPIEKENARTSSLERPAVTSVISRLLDTLNAKKYAYPLGFLRSIRLLDAMNWQES